MFELDPLVFSSSVHYQGLDEDPHRGLPAADAFLVLQHVDHFKSSNPSALLSPPYTSPITPRMR